MGCLKNTGVLWAGVCIVQLRATQPTLTHLSIMSHTCISLQNRISNFCLGARVGSRVSHDTIDVQSKELLEAQRCQLDNTQSLTFTSVTESFIHLNHQCPGNLVTTAVGIWSLVIPTHSPLSHYSNRLVRLKSNMCFFPRDEFSQLHLHLKLLLMLHHRAV